MAIPTDLAPTPSAAAATEGWSVPAALAPFLIGFAAIHEAMRRDVRRLPIAISAIKTSLDAAAIARWYRMYRAAIEHHHQREDDLVWPALVDRDPSFTAHIAGLSADHDRLAEALVAVETSLATLAAGRLDRRDEAVSAARLLSTLLQDHLDIEEAAAFGPLGRSYTAEEYHQLEQEMGRGMSIADIAFTGPWVLDGLDPDVAAEVLALFPALIRALHRMVFVRRYRALAAPLLAVGS